MTDLAFRTATDLAGAIGRRELGCLELLDHYLGRVDRLNPRLNAVVALDAEAARERARRADAALARGEAWGPLHGLPITIKDSFEVVGMPCTSGAPALRDHRPAANAPAVQRLLDAGAVIFGKTNLPLFAGDMQSYNEVYGTTNNPWDLTRGPGGSSGGAAAALAAGLAALELGSDIGGSIRNPAHYCGIYGHKPSFGIVPIRGHVPPLPGALANTDLGVAGPMARGADDLDLALGILAGPDGTEARAWRLELPEPRRSSLRDYRIGLWLDDPHCPVDAEVLALLEAAAAGLRAAGARVDAAKPDLDLAEHHGVYYHLLAAALSPGLPQPLFDKFADRLSTLAGDDGLRARFIRGATQRHRDWLAADETRARLRRRWDDFFRDYDVLLCPAMPTAAFPHDHEPDLHARTVAVNGRPFPYFGQIAWAGLATASYLPATVAPVGLTASGLPVGIQIIGPYLEDRTPVDLARRLADVIGGFAPPPGFA